MSAANAEQWSSIMYIGLIVFVAEIVLILTVWCCSVCCSRLYSLFTCGQFQEERNVDPPITTPREMDPDETSGFSRLHREAVAELSNTRSQ